MSRPFFRVLIWSLGFALCGCGRKAPNATPDGAVRELVDRMRSTHGGADEAKAAFELLSQRAKENLMERARRHSAATGKAINPEAMLVPSRFRLRFEPQKYVAQVAGIHALVEVSGLMPADRAQIPCIYENGAWWVDLALPPLPPMQQGPRTDL